MNFRKKNSVEELLRKSIPPAGDGAGAGEFWSDFKGQARMRSQEQLVRTRRSSIPIWSTGLGFAALLVLIAFMTFSGRVQATQVQYIDVAAAHTAVMILSSDNEDGTIVWIEGMKPDKMHLL